VVKINSVPPLSEYAAGNREEGTKRGGSPCGDPYNGGGLNVFFPFRDNEARIDVVFRRPPK